METLLIEYLYYEKLYFFFAGNAADSEIQV